MTDDEFASDITESVRRAVTAIDERRLEARGRDLRRYVDVIEKTECIFADFYVRACDGDVVHRHVLEPRAIVTERLETRSRKAFGDEISGALVTTRADVAPFHSIVRQQYRRVPPRFRVGI